MFVGTFCAFSGVLATSLPIPIIANNFNKFYYMRMRRERAEKLKAKQRREAKGKEKKDKNVMQKA